MIDTVRILDLSVSADALLSHERLLFPLPIDEQTGAVLDLPRTAQERGLRFTLTPTIKGDRLRCELRGSLHRYYNQGRHNADAFTAADLLATLDELVTSFGINPALSRLNNVEFGVNVALPFPVSQVLSNLIGYKYRPFTKEWGSGFHYYQCQTQRYVLKLYDKGSQYRPIDQSLPPHLLRVEVKVLKMEYLTRQGVRLDYLTDLLHTTNYERLGTLLVETFEEVLFDEPTLRTAPLSDRDRNMYKDGSNVRFWAIPEGLSGKEYDRHQKGLKRVEQRFRALVKQHRPGDDWQATTAALIGQTWQRLTLVDEPLRARIDAWLAYWQRPEANRKPANQPEPCPKLTGPTEPIRHPTCSVVTNSSTGFEAEKCPILTGYIGVTTAKNCPKLTGYIAGSDAENCPIGTERSAQPPGRGTVADEAQICPKLTGAEKPEMSDINPLSTKLISDKVPSAETGSSIGFVGRGTPTSHPSECVRPPAGPGFGSRSVSVPDQPAEPIATPGRNASRKRPTASQLRADEDLLSTVNAGQRAYAKGSQEDQAERAAHNLRNADSNPRNNLARRLRRIARTPALFPLSTTLHLTPDQERLLAYWQGTPYEIRLDAEEPKPGPSAAERMTE